MNKGKVREIVYILFSIIFAIFAIKLFIWLLPIVLIVLLASFIYRAIMKNKREEVYSKKESKTKTKKIVIIDEESNDN